MSASESGSACGAHGPGGIPCDQEAGTCNRRGNHGNGGNTWPISLDKWLGSAEERAAFVARSEMIGEVEREATRIETDHGLLTADDALGWCDGALDNAMVTRGKPEHHRCLVRLVAWGLTTLRAEAREMAAKGGGHG